MAEQKARPEDPKKDSGDAGGVSFVPKATPVVKEDGSQLPLGNETLEAQRKGFENAAKEGSPQGNPLERSGEDADFAAAKLNPQASGHKDVAGVEKEEVKVEKASEKVDKVAENRKSGK